MKSLKGIIALLLTLLLTLSSLCALSEGEEWICPDCGGTNTSNFCGQCGAPRPETPAFRHEGEGFDSPEAAVTCYMEGLRDLDFDRMLSAFAWETQMKHYDFKADFESTRVYSYTKRPRIPSDNPLVFSANVNSLRAAQTDMIYKALEKYILGDDFPEAPVMFEKDTDELDVFLQKFENGRLEQLSRMTNIRCADPDELSGGQIFAGRNAETFARWSAVYGADETVNLIGMADVGEETLFCCPTICRYGDRWYLVSANSFTTTWFAIPMEQQAFVCGPGSPLDLIH